MSYIIHTHDTIVDLNGQRRSRGKRWYGTVETADGWTATLTLAELREHVTWLRSIGAHRITKRTEP